MSNERREHTPVYEKGHQTKPEQVNGDYYKISICVFIYLVNKFV